MTDSEPTLARLRDTLAGDRGHVKMLSLNGTLSPTIEFEAGRPTVTPEEHELRTALVEECRPVLSAVADTIDRDPESVDPEDAVSLWKVGTTIQQAEPNTASVCHVAVADYLDVSREWVEGAERAAELFDSVNELPATDARQIALSCCSAASPEEAMAAVEARR